MGSDFKSSGSCDLGLRNVSRNSSVYTFEKMSIKLFLIKEKKIPVIRFMVRVIFFNYRFLTFMDFTNKTNLFIYLYILNKNHKLS